MEEARGVKRNNDGNIVPTSTVSGGIFEIQLRDFDDFVEFTPHCKGFIVEGGHVVPTAQGEAKPEGGIPFSFTSAPVKIPKKENRADARTELLKRATAQFNSDYEKAYRRAILLAKSNRDVSRKLQKLDLNKEKNVEKGSGSQQHRNYNMETD